jgi:hypothetical protein
MQNIYIMMGLPCSGKTKYVNDNFPQNANIYFDGDYFTNKDIQNLYDDKITNQFDDANITIVYFKKNQKQSLKNAKHKIGMKNNNVAYNELMNKIKTTELEYPNREQLSFKFTVVETDTFICPKFYKKLTDELKEFVFGNNFLLQENNVEKFNNIFNKLLRNIVPTLSESDRNLLYENINNANNCIYVDLDFINLLVDKGYNI